MMLVDIIIFSKEREAELKASLENLSQSNWRILVFHNSHRALELPIKYKNIEYFSCPDLNLSERAKLAISHLVSPYSIICSDDDRLVNSQLLKMKVFLDRNLEYATVGGSAAGAYLYGDRVTGSIAYREMQNYRNSFETSWERIQTHIHMGPIQKLPRAAMYRLYRRQHMETLLNVLGKCGGISTPYISEVASEFIAAHVGPSIYLPYLYWIRNWKTKMISNAQWNRRLDFCDWWEDGEYDDEKVSFIDILAESLKLDQNLLNNLITEYCVYRKPFVIKSPGIRFQVPRFMRNMKVFIYNLIATEKLPIEFSELIRNEFPRNSEIENQEVNELVRDMLLGNAASKGQ